MGDSHVGLQARLMSPGAAQDHRCAQHHRHHRDLHQPAPREDRRHVRLARDHDRWQGAEVLRLGPPRRAAHRDPQGRHRRGRQPHPRQGRQEQGGPAVQAGRVRHPLRPGHLPRGRPDRHGRRARLRPQGRRLVHLRRRPARAGQGERPHLPADNPDLADEIEKKIKEKLGIGPRVDAAEPPAEPPSTSERPGSSDAVRRLDDPSPPGRWGRPPHRDPEADPRPADARADPHDGARQILLASSPRPRAAAPSSSRRWPARTAPTTSPPPSSTGWRRSGSSTTPPTPTMLVRSRQAGRGLARRALAHELRRKGVDDDMAARRLDEVDPHDEEERARGLVAKLPSMAGLDPASDPAAGRDARPQGLRLGVVRDWWSRRSEAPEHQGLGVPGRGARPAARGRTICLP